jgi:hypothetical protein
MSRRASVSSSSSSVHSSSDWDDSGSVTNILTHSSVLTKLLKCLFILRGRHRHRRTTLPLSLALPCHWNVLRSRHL